MQRILPAASLPSAGIGCRHHGRPGRAFTIVELNVVILIMLLLAALIMPRIAAFQKTRQIKDLEGSIYRLPIEARNESVRAQVPVRLRVDNNALVMERVPMGGNPEQVKQVALTSDIQVDSVQKGGQSTDTGSWNWTAYPDGTADSAGIQFVEGTLERSMALPSNGNPVWTLGALTANGPDSWPSGQLVQRG